MATAPPIGAGIIVSKLLIKACHEEFGSLTTIQYPLFTFQSSRTGSAPARNSTRSGGLEMLTNQFPRIGTDPASAAVLSCGICAIHAIISFATLLAFPTNDSLVLAVSLKKRSTRTTAGTGACADTIFSDS